ncbi:hypothetical protein [Stakelama marina]|uniref:Lipoprotein n=1 Tax=Stakelama marina TaxID=2826939 RepID=A0A8T4IA71_9SPHN|nr:hypothetical protein [Stakelama marina]MBR0551918.1 hypothetical protein [Stakelama marina]
MRIAKLWLIGALSPLALTACGQTGSQAADSNSVSTGNAYATTPTINSADDVETNSAGETNTEPVSRPTPKSPVQDEAGDADAPKAAADVVKRYYADIDSGDYRAAYALWGDGGKDSKQTLEQFRDGFANTESTDVSTGDPGRSEGAAGSIYITVPVTVRAQLRNGTHQRFTGSYVLRRVNDVPGSTAEQRRWHLYSADLEQAR